MNVLVLHAHPDPTSFNRALVDRAVAGLESAGHDCELIDLYGIDYRAALSTEEHAGYASREPIVDPVVAQHARLVQSCDVLVFVYPTWWSSLPAILKGWMERTLVPGVAFDLDPGTGTLAPRLQHIHHIVGITTYGSPWWYVKLVNDAGRRTLSRTLRTSTGWRTRVTWLGLYELDAATEHRRTTFLRRVETRMGRLR